MAGQAFAVEETRNSKGTLYALVEESNASVALRQRNIIYRPPGLEQERQLLRILPQSLELITSNIITPYQFLVRHAFSNVNLNRSHLFVPFNDLTAQTTSIDLLKLSLGLTEQNTSVMVRMDVNTHGRQFEGLSLGQDSRRMLSLPNAGGASMLSEVLSYEIMERILGIKLLLTEMEITYLYTNQPMTDYLVKLRHPYYATSLIVGVSVTRAYRHAMPFSKDDARRLLTKKLAGINSSTKNINNARVWKQILHVWCPSSQVANVVKGVYKKMSSELRANTVLVLSVIESKWVFTNNKVVYGTPRKKDLPKKKKGNPKKKNYYSL